jgi:hypothetical protein
MECETKICPRCKFVNRADASICQRLFCVYVFMNSLIKHAGEDFSTDPILRAHEMR